MAGHLRLTPDDSIGAKHGFAAVVEAQKLVIRALNVLLRLCLAANLAMRDQTLLLCIRLATLVTQDREVILDNGPKVQQTLIRRDVVWQLIHCLCLGESEIHGQQHVARLDQGLKPFIRSLVLQRLIRCQEVSHGSRDLWHNLRSRLLQRLSQVLYQLVVLFTELLDLPVEHFSEQVEPFDELSCELALSARRELGRPDCFEVFCKLVDRVVVMAFELGEALLDATVQPLQHRLQLIVLLIRHLLVIVVLQRAAQLHF